MSEHQFRTDLFTPRFIRDSADHNSDARIALVARSNNRTVAFVSGGLVINGDEVVDGGTAYIQAIIAKPSAGDAIVSMLESVVAHLRAFEPKRITACDGLMCPRFFADSAGLLPLRWAWLGQRLLDAGFQVSSRSARLVALLAQPRRQVRTPAELEFLHVKHEMKRFDPDYDFGCLLMKPPYERGDGVVWCGNFYSGTFVTGTAYESLYMNYFSILDDEYRRKGLGRLILQHCLHEAQKKGSRYASLLTDADNFVAQNLYLSEGFEVVDIMYSFEFPIA